MRTFDLDSPGGHLFCVLLLFFTGTALFLVGEDYGKDIMTGAMGALFALINTHRGAVNNQPQNVNQAEVINVSPKESKP